MHKRRKNTAQRSNWNRRDAAARRQATRHGQLQRFLQWTRRACLSTWTPAVLQGCLLKWAHGAFFEGGFPNDLWSLLAALQWKRSNLSVKVPGPPRVRDALQGWKRTASAPSRLPLPWPGCALVVNYMVPRAQWPQRYLRPWESAGQRRSVSGVFMSSSGTCNANPNQKVRREPPHRLFFTWLPLFFLGLIRQGRTPYMAFSLTHNLWASREIKPFETWVSEFSGSVHLHLSPRRCHARGSHLFQNFARNQKTVERWLHLPELLHLVLGVVLPFSSGTSLARPVLIFLQGCEPRACLATLVGSLVIQVPAVRHVCGADRHWEFIWRATLSENSAPVGVMLFFESLCTRQ